MMMFIKLFEIRLCTCACACNNVLYACKISIISSVSVVALILIVKKYDLFILKNVIF